MGGGIFSMLARVVFGVFLIDLLGTGWTLGVNLAAIFFLRVLVSLSV